MKVNYDEAAVPPYELPELLRFADGRPVAKPSDWPERRREILGVFAREMYGQQPPAPEAVECELSEEGPTLSGLGIRRQYRMWFRRDRTGPFVDWLLVLPNRIKGQAPKIENGRVICENGERCPVVLMLNYRGNHGVLNDPEVQMPEGAWFCDESKDKVNGNDPREVDRGYTRDSRSHTTIPAGFLVSRGYALLTACYGQISPDAEPGLGYDHHFAYTHIFDLWPKRDESREDNTTSLGAWAWTLSRGLDLAERIPEIEAKRNIVTGYSRLGKTALLAAARDERFAVCVPNQTGGGGVPLAKRFFGENVATEMKSFPHWYCRAYGKYAGNEAEMPFDQHWLLACIAPRSLLVQGFNDPWFDAKGEFLACQAASPAWELHGLPGLPEGGFSEPFDTSRIGPRLGYVRRGGAHGMSAFDWGWMLDFAEPALAQLGKAGACESA